MRALGINATLAAVFETIYGATPASGSVAQLPFVSYNLGETRALLPDEQLGYGREMLAPTQDAADNTGEIVVPVDDLAFGLWMKALYGQPTTTALTGANAGKYQHAFSSGSQAIPSLSLELARNDIGAFSTSYGVCANTLKISMTRKGRLTATIGLIGQGETMPTGVAALTPASPLVGHRFVQAQGSVAAANQSMGDVISADLMYSNNLDPIQGIRPDGRISGIDALASQFNGSFKSRFSNLSFYTGSSSGISADLTFQWTHTSGSSLTFEAQQVFCGRDKLPVTGPGGILWEPSFEAAMTPGANRSVYITLVNTRPSY